MKQILNIYGVEYEVLEISSEEMNTETDFPLEKGEKLFGLHDGFACKIFIDNSLSVANKRRTLIHEITHAIVSVLGYRHTTKPNEEFICEFIGAHLDYIYNLVNGVVFNENVRDLRS